MRNLLVLFLFDCKVFTTILPLDRFVADPDLVHLVLILSTMYVCMLAQLNEALDRLKHGPSQSTRRILETSDTSSDETNTSKGRRKLLSKKTFSIRRVHGASELGRFFVTRPTDAANKPSHFCCRVFRRDVSVLAHGHNDISKNFQSARHFSRDQRLRLETPAWRVLGFHGNPLSDDELKWLGQKYWMVPLCFETVSIPLRKTWLLMGLVLLTQGCQHFWRCRAWSIFEDVRQLRACRKTIGSVFSNCRTRQRRNSLDPWRSYNKFRKFPESLRLIPDLPCYFAFGQPSWLKCCPNSCRVWLDDLEVLSLQFGVWGAWSDYLDGHANVGEGHVPMRCLGGLRPFIQWCSTLIVFARFSCGCRGWFSITCCCFWWVAFAGWHLRRLPGLWEWSQIG